MLPEWDRATGSVLDGIQIIQRAARGALVKVLDKPYLTSNTMGRVGEHVLILELALRKIANRKRPRLGGVSSRSRKRAGSITSLKRLTHGAGGIARRFPFQKAASSAHQNFAWTCWMSFLAKHCPKRCSTNNPPSDVIGSSHWAHPDLVVEIQMLQERRRLTFAKGNGH